MWWCSAAACRTRGGCTTTCRGSGGATSFPTTWPRGSCQPCTGIRVACAARPGCGAAPRAGASGSHARRPRALVDDARRALEGPVGPRPVDQHDDAVPEADQEVDVRGEPGDPGEPAPDVDPGEHRDRGGATDGRQLSVVAVAESPRP